ncbi:hypothetical protein [Actinoplanes sp. G11-F43]|uniref:hypothetical protein n=1 Tax=Actinoplanes sp. G11-F43 TaxID=3424130 RepID=UPI003D34F12E
MREHVGHWSTVVRPCVVHAEHRQARWPPCPDWAAGQGHGSQLIVTAPPMNGCRSGASQCGGIGSSKRFGTPSRPNRTVLII